MNEVRRYWVTGIRTTQKMGYANEWQAVDASDYDALAARLAAAEELNRIAAVALSEKEQEIERLKGALVRMEADRDDARTERNTAVLGNNILRDKLAASQARVRELEEQLNHSQEDF